MKKRGWKIIFKWYIFIPVSTIIFSLAMAFIGVDPLTHSQRLATWLMILTLVYLVIGGKKLMSEK